MEKKFKPTKKNSSFFGPTEAANQEITLTLNNATDLKVGDWVVVDIPCAGRSQNDANSLCRSKNINVVDLNKYKSPIRRNLKGYLNFYRSSTTDKEHEKENSSDGEEEKIDYSDNKKFFSDEKYDAFLEEFFDKERDGNDEFQLLEILNEKLVSLGLHVNIAEWVIKSHQEFLSTLLGHYQKYKALKYMKLHTEEDIQGSHEAMRETMRELNEYSKKYNEKIDNEQIDNEQIDNVPEPQIKFFEKDRKSLDGILSTFDELRHNSRSYIEYLMQQNEIKE